MISLSKVTFRGCGEYDNQGVFLEIGTHLSFSSHIHYSLILTVNNPNAPTSQLGKLWAEEGSRTGWCQPQKRRCRGQISRPELLLYIDVRNGDGSTHLHGLTFCKPAPNMRILPLPILASSLSLPHPIPLLLFDFQLPLSCASSSISPSVTCAPGCPIWLDPLNRLNPCM